MISDEQRKAGYKRPYRAVVTHKRCGANTALTFSVADLLARHPGFLSGLYCSKCRGVYAARQFVWLSTRETLDGKDGA